MLLSLNNVTKAFGEKTILSGITATIEDNDKIGLIGANGIGKSTLLNIINKLLEHDFGNIDYNNELKIGFLKQDSGLIKNSTIIGEMKNVFSDLLEIEKNLRQLEKYISKIDVNSDEYSIKSKEYSELSHYFEHVGGYDIDYKIKTILNGMGFSDKSYEFNVSSLSGGEKTRLALAKLLLEQPQLLILDEPTNHLDFRTLTWLEDYLKDYKGALLIVSHDRYFLDKMVTKIWELENKVINVYKGNYSKYKQLRTEKIIRQQKEYDLQQIKINSMLEYVEKNIARDSTSNSAKSRLHQLENMVKLEPPYDYTKEPKFEFSSDKNPVKDVLDIADLNLSVGAGADKITLFDNLNLHVFKGEKIAIIGDNGVGKSTLLKSIMGMISQKGEITWGRNAVLGYYDQENTNLNPNKIVIDELWDRFLNFNETQIRKILGNVLLSNDDVYKYVNVLSGGEKAKLGLAILMTQRSNVLILDEPTNHLDLQSKESLEEALKTFDGTLIFVSHDRYFLNAIPTRIVEMTKAGEVNNYIGNFDFYMQERTKIQKAIEEEINNRPRENDTDKKTTYRSKQQRSDDVKKRTYIKNLEDSIDNLENKINELNEIITDSNNVSNYELLHESCVLLEETKKELEEVFLEWSEAI